MAAGETVLQQTESVCPECLARIPATLVAISDQVLMVKECDRHGVFRSTIWRGSPAFNDWRRSKAPAKVRQQATSVERGCPFDCGICPDHRQLGCTGLLEVTSRCNLSCRVCFADSGPVACPDPSLVTVAGWYRNVMAVNGPCSIQLSGESRLCATTCHRSSNWAARSASLSSSSTATACVWQRRRIMPGACRRRGWFRYFCSLTVLMMKFIGSCGAAAAAGKIPGRRKLYNRRTRRGAGADLGTGDQ